MCYDDAEIPFLWAITSTQPRIKVLFGFLLVALVEEGCAFDNSNARILSMV